MHTQTTRGDGVPVVGFTGIGRVDVKDRDTALTRQRGNVNPVGLTA